MDDCLFIEHSPLGYKVCCYKSDWENHIICETGHPIMKENLQSVQMTVKDPDVVYLSSQWENRDIYFKRCVQATYGGILYTKVVVEKPDIKDEHGYVVTSWPNKGISGNIKEGGLLYVRPKL